MKISQGGIEEVRKNPKLLRAIKCWLKNKEEFFCPLSALSGEDNCNPKLLCKKIFPALDEDECPCTQYSEEEVIQIAKQIMGEE